MKFVEAVEKALEILLPSLDDVRKRWGTDHEFFKKAAEGCANLRSAVTLMRIYGLVDPEEYERIEKNFERLEESL